jgi:hemolysin III
MLFENEPQQTRANGWPQQSDFRIAATGGRYHLVVQSPYKLGDILANAITHGIGAVLAVVGAIYLIAASTHGTAWHIVSCSAFAVTLVMVYVCSTLYHSLVRTRARHVLHILDHSSIYLLIAGTYTPFCLISLHGRLGWTIFGIEWGLAAAGVVFKSFAVGRFPVASALVYLAQGWFVVVALGPLIHALGWHGMMWLGTGGLAYTLGVFFFALDRLRYFHATWHLFVLAGSIAHYFAILLYVLPVRP